MITGVHTVGEAALTGVGGGRRRRRALAKEMGFDSATVYTPVPFIETAATAAAAAKHGVTLAGISVGTAQDERDRASTYAGTEAFCSPCVTNVTGRKSSASPSQNSPEMTGETKE